MIKKFVTNVSPCYQMESNTNNNTNSTPSGSKKRSPVRLGTRVSPRVSPRLPTPVMKRVSKPRSTFKRPVLVNDGKMEMDTETDQSMDSVEDIKCEICKYGDNEDTLVLCDGCNRGFHTSCMNLPAVPVSNWSCSGCKRVINNTEMSSPVLVPHKEVFLYERVSTKGQNEPQYGRVGLDTQNTSLLNFVMSKGLFVKGTFREVGSAYRKVHREVIHKLVSKVKRGDFIVVYSVSRFTRNVNEGTLLLQKMHAKNAYVYAVLEDCYSYEDKFLLQMKMAQTESENLSSKMKEVVARIRNQGGHIGPAPYGKSVVRDEKGLRKLVFNEEEDKILQQIKRGPSQALVDKLNKQRKLYRGKLWTYEIMNNLYLKHNVMKGFAKDMKAALEE